MHASDEFFVYAKQAIEGGECRFRVVLWTDRRTQRLARAGSPTPAECVDSTRSPVELDASCTKRSRQTLPLLRRLSRTRPE